MALIVKFIFNLYTVRKEGVEEKIMERKDQRHLMWLVGLIAFVILYGFYYFNHLEEKIRSHVDTYTWYPLLLLIFGIILGVRGFKQKNRIVKLLDLSSASILIIIMQVCWVLMERVNCCPGG